MIWKLKCLLAKATPGKWEVTHISPGIEQIHVAHDDGTHTMVGFANCGEDADTVVALRNNAGPMLEILAAVATLYHPRNPQDWERRKLEAVIENNLRALRAP